MAKRKILLEKKEAHYEGKDTIMGRYDLYKEYNKIKLNSFRKYRHTINCKDEFNKFKTVFFKTIRECLLESVAGVHVKGFGYFSFVLDTSKNKRKTVRRGSKRVREFLSPYTDYKYYAMCFIPSRQFTFWSFDDSWESTLRTAAREKIYGGKRYKTYFNTFKHKR